MHSHHRRSRQCAGSSAGSQHRPRQPPAHHESCFLPSAPTTDEDAAGTPTAATTSMPRQRLRSIPLMSTGPSLAEGTESGHATVARNAFYLVLGQAMTTALAMIFSAKLGRTLGASDFGLYFLIASFSTFAYVLVDWGQQFYVIREVACKPERR